MLSKAKDTDDDNKGWYPVLMLFSSRDGSGRWIFPNLECLRIPIHFSAYKLPDALQCFKAVVLSRLEATDCTSIRSLTVSGANLNRSNLLDLVTLRLLVPEAVLIR